LEAKALLASRLFFDGGIHPLGGAVDTCRTLATDHPHPTPADAGLTNAAKEGLQNPDRKASIGFTQELNDLFLRVSLLHRSDLRLGSIGL
jgi:hypothetical protein